MGITAVNPFELPLLNTVILLSSGVTITYAHHSVIQGNRRGALDGTVATVMLALIFTGLDIISMLFFGAGFTVSLLGVIWTLTINNHYISDTIAKRACPGVSSILKTFPSPLGTEARGAH